MNKLFPFLFISLIFFILIDYISTYYAVIYLKATELNPLYLICGDFKGFMLLKTCFTGVGLIMMILIRNSFMRSALLSLTVLNILYGLIVISNMYQIGCELIR